MKVRCYQITPSGSSEYDYLILPAGKTWKPVLENIEAVLDNAFCEQDDPDGLDWVNIRAEIKCVWVDSDNLIEMGYRLEDFSDSVNVALSGPSVNEVRTRGFVELSRYAAGFN